MNKGQDRGKSKDKSKSLGKIISIGFNTLILLCVLLLGIAVMSSLWNQAPTLFGYSIIRLTTDSMMPAYPAKTCLLVHQCEPDTLAVGDVISFYSDDPAIAGKPNTHRIVSIIEGDQGFIYTTKGDANPVEDSFPVSYNQVIGKVVCRLIWIEKLISFMSTPAFYFVGILIPMVCLIISQLRTMVEAGSEHKKRREACAVLEEAGFDPKDEKLVDMVLEYGIEILEQIKAQQHQGETGNQSECEDQEQNKKDKVC